MELNITYSNDLEYYAKYIALFYNDLRLTERESQILVQIIDKFINLYKSDSNNPDKELFSDIIQFCKQNNLSVNQYHNIKNALIEKGALIKTEDGIFLNRLLLPRKNITFKFIKNDR